MVLDDRFNYIEMWNLLPGISGLSRQVSLPSQWSLKTGSTVLTLIKAGFILPKDKAVKTIAYILVGPKSGTNKCNNRYWLAIFIGSLNS